MSSNKIYLGDAVYAEFDGYGVIMTTENGFYTENTIYLEPNVLNNLNKFYMSQIQDDLKKRHMNSMRMAEV